MERIFKHLIILLTAFFMQPASAFAQDLPTIAPTATYINANGDEETIGTGDSYSGSAPLTVQFKANPEHTEGWTEYYEWRFCMEGDMDNPYMQRYEQDTEFTFNSAGAHKIVCYASFSNGSETVEYTKEYWTEECSPIGISIYDSKLEMPNGFSPNGDEFNPTYKPKSGYQSIVEFHAYIFNRWGVKLYEWDDIDAEGWDGTYKGRPVPEGVYFCLVKAKGADGRVFNIKRDVNLLRRKVTEETTTEPTE